MKNKITREQLLQREKVAAKAKEILSWDYVIPVIFSDGMEEMTADEIEENFYSVVERVVRASRKEMEMFNEIDFF